MGSLELALRRPEGGETFAGEVTRQEEPVSPFSIPMVKVSQDPWYTFPTLSKKDWLFVTAAVFFVTFLGPTLATIALFELPVALVIALTSIGPLYALPAVYLEKAERVTVTGVAGAFLTVSGVAVLCSSVSSDA